MPAQKQVSLFAHLPQYEKEKSITLKVRQREVAGDIHPAIICLGLKYADGSISGSNARCVAMLAAFKEVILDYRTPVSKSLHRDLETGIKPMIQFLIDCRPLSISMGNAINYLKKAIISTAQMTEDQAKAELIRRIENFVIERIQLADKVIASHAITKINNGDVVLTYASSHVVELLLKTAFDEEKDFRVVVVDSSPRKEGKELFTRLVQYGLQCSYVLINAISFIMKEVTKVFVGASTLLANGNVVSRAGTAVVAMVAYNNNVPVMVCCETYKFAERVQLDSICFNELGDPDELLSATKGTSEITHRLEDWRNNPKLKLLNLVYDLTPMKFVMMVITEIGMIPPTAVPVVIREYTQNWMSPQ